MYQIVEYFNFNPNATAMQAIGHLEKEMEIKQNVQYIKDEVPIATDARIKLRPLFGQKRDIIERMKYMEMDFAVDVALEYPPRKGTKEDRDAMMDKLKAGSKDYQELGNQLLQIGDQIMVIEDRLHDAENNAKNARRIVELFEAYVKFVTQFRKN